MKAKDLVKNPVPEKEIYEQIKQANDRNEFKFFIPHWRHVSDETKLKLMNDGFRVYTGEFMRGDHGLIIEW